VRRGRSGIAEPISDAGQTDKTGLGLNQRAPSKTSGGEEVEDLFEWYRKQRSGMYHSARTPQPPPAPADS
jgi:hypothetical protein